MPTDDTRLRNIMDLFVLDDFDKIKSYLRNFIIKIDEADSIYINNNFGSIAEGIDGFMDLLFDHSYDDHRYKPRKFIYTTTQIYSSLPDYFQQNYKLITPPDKDNEEDIIQRIKTVVTERYENRFEIVDWENLIDDYSSLRSRVFK